MHYAAKNKIVYLYGSRLLRFFPVEEHHYSDTVNRSHTLEENYTRAICLPLN